MERRLGRAPLLAKNGVRREAASGYKVDGLDMFFADEIKRALALVPASPLQRAIIRELARQPQSAPELTACLGLRHFVQVNCALGGLGRQVRQKLSAHPDGLPDGEYQWWHVLATAKKQSRGWIWSLRAEVRAAAAELGWLREVELPLPEESGANDVLVDGAVRTVMVNRYERDPRLREACIRLFGARCFVCGVDLGQEYGAYALGFIHVHHLKSLSEMDGEGAVDPARDLRPLCPNCHAVAHLKTPAFTMEEMREMRARSKRDTSAEPADGSAPEGPPG
jgi:5-methylcytosine-specific restriction enzyme A